MTMEAIPAQARGGQADRLPAVALEGGRRRRGRSGRLPRRRPHPPADSGDVAADLRDWLHDSFEWLGDPATTALVRGLAAAAADSATDAERLYERFTGPNRLPHRVRP